MQTLKIFSEIKTFCEIISTFWQLFLDTAVFENAVDIQETETYWVLCQSCEERRK